MRNLKKILALVLALVMSLSLMATASAADFKDASDITENYQTAVNVLEGLKVFKGYEDGSFNPKGEITRAEVATIIYRIATGDAEDKQASIYTDMTTSFTDLNKAEWAKGFVNYCHNAQIIKGESKTKFNPNGKITGYATLAMILRAMGYGKNGEFEGTEWEYHTAAKAKEIGLIDNVIEAQLGSNAPRELVAEILFRALLTAKVDYTVLGGYQPNGKTLGQEQFGLEKVEGVVMANEWANLNDNAAKGNKVLAAGKTEMKVAKVQDVGATVEVGKAYTLDYATDLDAVGLNHTAYIANKTGEKQVLTMEATGNTVDYNEGKAKSVSGLATTDLTKDTEWFINYDQEWLEEAKSDIIIRYSVMTASIKNAYAAGNITKSQQDTWLAWLENAGTPSLGGAPTGTVAPLTESGKTVGYTRTIRPETEITEIDQEIMREIFYSADKTGINWIRGEVYAGTETNNDKSDTMSWVEFVDKYFITDVNTKKFSSVENGNSLRIIDNNGDGNAEYVLKIAYTQAKAVDTLKDALLFSSGLNMGKYTDNNLDSHDELALNDIANYYVIDGKLSIWKADVVTDKVATKNWQDVTVTLSNGDVKGQSGIKNATTLDDNIKDMSDKPEYNMYLDEYGYIRTYELAQGKKYALLTEMYNGTLQNYNYLTTTRWIAEMKAGNEALTERIVTNANGSIFATPAYAWTSRDLTLNGVNVSTSSSLNYLQPATAHLGCAANVGGTATGGGTPAYRDNSWPRNVFGVGLNEMFDWGRVGYTKTPSGAAAPANSSVPNSFSFTNVATYTLEDEAVFLETAAKKHTNTSGEQLYRSTVPSLVGKDAGTVLTKAQWMDAWKVANKDTSSTKAETWFTSQTTKTSSTRSNLYEVYATDYVQLAKQSYAAGMRHYNIYTNTDTSENYAIKYNTLSNGYVDATVNTEYYIVTPNDVKYVVGYDSLFSIDSSKVRAAYAVAQNTAKDKNGEDYWVADVIVIEVNESAFDYDSIALMYYNPWETSGQVRNVNSLDNDWRLLQPDYDGLAKMDIVPAYTGINGASVTWGLTPWSGSSYGFYKLYDIDPESNTNGNITAGDARIIDSNWNDYGIYAGTVKRVTEVLSTSNYIDIDLGNGTIKHVTVNGSAFKTPVYRDDSNVVSPINLLNDPDLDPYGVQLNDKVIVVYNKADKSSAKNPNSGVQAAYIVDVRDGEDLNRDGKADWTVPTWLTGLYNKILASQKPVATPDTNPITFYDVKIKGKPVTMTGDYGTVTLDNSVAADATTAAINDLTFKTSVTNNANIKVLNGSATVTGSLSAPTWTSTSDTDLRSWTTKTDAGKVRYIIVLDDATGVVTGNARTITIDVNVLAASADNNVSAISVKGKNANRVESDPAANDGTAPGKRIHWEVSLTAEQAASTTLNNMVLTLGHPVGSVIKVTYSGITNIAVADPYVDATTAISVTAGGATTGTVDFQVTAENGDVRYYSLAVTIGVQTAIVEPTVVGSNSSKTGSISGKNCVLTVPAGVTVTGSNLSNYLNIDDNLAAGQTYTASVSGDKITIVVSETGKESRTETVTWKNQELFIKLTAAAENTTDGYEIKLDAKTITLSTGAGRFTISNTVPVTAAISGGTPANPAAVLGGVDSGITPTLKYDLVSNTGNNNVFQANVDSVGAGDAGKYLRITATATVAGQPLETVTNLLIGEGTVA